jgi:hypothetical protein
MQRALPIARILLTPRRQPQPFVNHPAEAGLTHPRPAALVALVNPCAAPRAQHADFLSRSFFDFDHFDSPSL